MQIVGYNAYVLRMILDEFRVIPTRSYYVGIGRRLSDMLVVRATFSSAKRADIRQQGYLTTLPSL